MNLQEHIKKTLREELNNQVKKFLYDNFFDKVFNNTEFDGSDVYNMIWYNNKGKKIFTRNWWGILWVDDCYIYKKLRMYSKILSIDLDTFETYLIEYLNQRYEKEFIERPLKEVGDEYGCLDEDLLL